MIAKLTLFAFVLRSSIVSNSRAANLSAERMCAYVGRPTIIVCGELTTMTFYIVAGDLELASVAGFVGSDCSSLIADGQELASTAGGAASACTSPIADTA